jgi:hypothetical protein
MSDIPKPIQHISSMIDSAHEGRQERPRPHLGCSTLGHHCDRWLWLSFRWAVVESFPGRILRLFRRGQLEEDLIISDLRSIGIDIEGSQDRVDFGSHVSGSVDGIIHHGVPTAEKTKHVAEFKTHSKKSFDDLKKGVKASKPMHYVQMQVYMLGLKLKRALYVAVCKDDDRLHTERIYFDEDVANKAVAPRPRLVPRGTASDLPQRISPSIFSTKAATVTQSTQIWSHIIAKRLTASGRRYMSSTAKMF